MGDNLGLAIISVAIVTRTLMTPMTIKQIKLAEMNREFSEKVKELKRKYKDDKERQQKEIMQINSQYLPAQLGGCLPMIFQVVFFIYAYRVIRDIVNTGGLGFNKVAYSFVDKFPSDYKMDGNFFGIFDAIKSPAQAFGDHGFGVKFLPYIILIVAVGISQYMSMKILSAIRKSRKPEKVEKKKKEDEKEDFSEIMQRSTKQTMMLMPLMIMFFSYNLPSALALYWITQSSFVVVQQSLIAKIRGDLDPEGSKTVKSNSSETEVIEADSMLLHETDDLKKRLQKKKRQKKNKKKRQTK
ncbi:MAG: YidC/Oxa1 family membrane protein insertase [Candidatus Dojkabacteria bacterium]|nr:YidC/Oxa1 family membrane protein insertase [Candidatus Dojkabacteria bacterium]